MLSPEAVLLVANGFFTVKLARGSRRTAPGCSKDSFAAALPNFPHPFTKGESHVVTLARFPTNSFSCSILQASSLPSHPKCPKASNTLLRHQHCQHYLLISRTGGGHVVAHGRLRNGIPKSQSGISHRLLGALLLTRRNNKVLLIRSTAGPQRLLCWRASHTCINVLV